jgi:DinB superfamily
MFAHERTLYAFLLDYAGRLIADVPDEHLAAHPAPGMNHPLWVLGHLTVAADYGLEIVGRPYAAPSAFHDLFGPGTEPTPDRAKYPPWADVLTAYQAGHAAFAAAAAEADPARMRQPNELGFLPELTTLGAVVAHLLTTHEGIHLGQLSAWRRAAGLAAV